MTRSQRPMTGFISLLLLVLPSPGRADFTAGAQAVNRGDNETVWEAWRPLAEHGDAPTQYLLGVMYDTGEGVQQDYQEAVRWYQRAAEQGHAQAQYTLALMYSSGTGVTQDTREAARWYRLAAEQGHALGQVMLGQLHRDGRGVPLDYVQALLWFTLSAAQGNVVATVLRDGLASKMMPPQIAEADRLTREWKPKKHL